MTIVTPPINILDLPPHPLADIFPLMEDEEFQTLVKSIERDGCREPLTYWHDPETGDPFTLDGRNRVRACKKLSVDPEAVKAEEFKGTLTDVAHFIIGRNIARRHMKLREQIVAVASMVMQNPEDFLPDRKSADKCKVVAELGGFVQQSVRKYLKKDLTPKTDEELLKERAERAAADERRDQKKAEEGAARLIEEQEQAAKAAEAEYIKSLFSDNGDDPDEDPDVIRDKAAERAFHLLKLAANESAEAGETENAREAAKRLIERHDLTEEEIKSADPDARAGPEWPEWPENSKVNAKTVRLAMDKLLREDGDEATIGKIAALFGKEQPTKQMRTLVEEFCNRAWRHYAVTRNEDGSIDLEQPIRYRVVEPTRFDKAIENLNDGVDCFTLTTELDDAVTQYQESDDADERARVEADDGLIAEVQEVHALGEEWFKRVHAVNQRLVGTMLPDHREWLGIEPDEPDVEAEAA